MTEDLLYGHSLLQWTTAIGVAGATYLVLRLIKAFVQRRLAGLAQRTSNPIDDMLVHIVGRGTRELFLVAIALYAGSVAIALPERVADVLRGIALAAMFAQVALWADGAIRYGFAQTFTRRAQTDPESASAFSLLALVARIGLWTLVILAALHNLGINITALATGLGVAGVAVALAVQNILGDLFASLSIILDKPFVVGDFIIVDSYMGTVEHVGIKTTRVRSLSGEQIVFSNADLLNSRIRNYKRMFERRVLFQIGVTYQTPHEKLAAIPGMLREAVESQPHVRFDRAHFASYGDSALLFEVVYYVRSSDYNLYMDIQQAINLEINRRFALEGIEFAYPTRTVYLARADGATPDEVRVERGNQAVP